MSQIKAVQEKSEKIEELPNLDNKTLEELVVIAPRKTS